MPRYIIVTVLFLIQLSGVAFGQDLTIQYNTEAVPVRQLDSTSWEVTLDGEPYIVLRKSDLSELARRAELQEAEIERYKTVTASLDSSLEAYRQYREAADQHIETQERLIQTADSLYLGYQSLYEDLKRYSGLTSWSIMTGLGVLNPPESNMLLSGMIGLRYQSWVGQFHFGKKTRGVLIGFQYAF